MQRLTPYKKVIEKTVSWKIVEDIDYRSTGSDESKIIAVNMKSKIAVRTDFYDTDDFYLDSDYHQMVVDETNRIERMDQEESDALNAAAELAHP